MTSQEITKLYQESIGRPATQAEIDHHVRNNTSRRALDSFLYKSPEAKAERLVAIKKMYVDYIGRKPTSSEIDHHFRNETTLSDLMNWAKTSPEAKTERTRLGKVTVPEPTVPEVEIGVTTPDVEITTEPPEKVVEKPPEEVVAEAPEELTNYDYWKIYQEFGLDISPEEIAHHVENQTSLEHLRNWLVTNQPELIRGRAEAVPRAEITPYEAISSERRAEMRAAAEEEIIPYYEERVAIPKREARIGIGELYDEMRVARTRSARNLTQALDESSAAMAARGLAFSGIREAEAGRVKTREQEALRDVLAPLEQRIGVGMRGLEETIGTQAMQRTYPEWQLAPEFIGLYGGREGITGAIPRERMETIEEALSGRLAEEREQRQWAYQQQFLQGYGI